MKIALCDDDPLELEKIKYSIDNFIINNQSDDEIALKMFTNPDDLLCHIDKCDEFDLYILDIIMPYMDGIELAAEIRNRNTRCRIIFLTSSPEFAVNSYKVDAFYYLLKPFISDELVALLNKALDQMKKEVSASILLREPGKITRVQTHSIRYIESIMHTIYFHLHNGEILSCYGTMKEYDGILMADQKFVRCHKSFIVNMNYVASITGRDFILSDNVMIPISRQSYPHVKSAYIDYFFRKANESA